MKTNYWKQTTSFGGENHTDFHTLSFLCFTLKPASWTALQINRKVLYEIEEWLGCENKLVIFWPFYKKFYFSFIFVF